MTPHQLAALFNGYAQYYSTHTTLAEQKARAQGLEMLDVSQHQRVLELGCGVGEDLVQIAGRAAQATAMDGASEMVLRAKERLDEAGIAAEILTGLAPPLPAPDNSYDSAWCSLTLELQTWPDAAMIVDELHRVLCSEGRLGLVAHACSWPDHKEIDGTATSWQAAFRAADHDAVHWKSLLTDSGFRIQASQRVSLGDLDADILVAVADGEPQRLPDVDALVAGLQSRQAVQRIVARQRLTLQGEAAVEPLCQLAADRNDQHRAEAVKCLLWLSEPAAVPKLIERLEDSSQQVRWLAAKALIKIGNHDSVVERLTHPASDSVRLYASAGQVLRALCRRGATELTPLVDAFEGEHLETAVPVAARQLRESPSG